MFAVQCVAAQKSGPRAFWAAPQSETVPESHTTPTDGTAKGRAAVGEIVTLDRLPDLDPAEGEVLDAELAVTDDVLEKAFALGPGAELAPHEHPDATNVFHVLRGSVVLTQDDVEETVEAPAVVLNERGQVHGARNESGEIVVLTASLCPLPG